MTARASWRYIRICNLCAASMNAMILETVRGFYNGGWYADVYT
ncbi:MAG TPA: hypothetical protein VGO37_22020 [Steroidobacteraceae bacterium]|nr:hypothetical protein [Steroidobacteraceae bacterium]